MNTPWNVLVVVVDRLSASLLGPYGNTWVQTPAFNRLASQSLLAEFLLATSQDLAAAYRSLWSGQHPLASGDATPLPQHWREQGRRTLLISDEPAVFSWEASSAFDDHFHLDFPLPQRPANSVDQTAFSDVIAAALERLDQTQPPFAAWLHARGLSAPWDAPHELREHLRDDEDPPAADFVEPPALRLPTGFDPDELLPYSQAAAAQAMVVDECLELLLDHLDRTGRSRDTLLVVTSPRGCLLGQQGFVGNVRDVLLEDALHVPLLVRYPDGRDAAVRHLGLCEPRDLFPLLVDPQQTTLPERDRLLLLGAGERGVRTRAWYLRTDEHAEGQPRHELYAKPDDRYEVNDVASRAKEIVEQLIVVGDELHAALSSTTSAELAPLAPELSDTWR